MNVFMRALLLAPFIAAVTVPSQPAIGFLEVRHLSGQNHVDPKHVQEITGWFASHQEEPLPAKSEHEGVAAEVAMERAKFTETGRSLREKELLSNMGRLEDQLEGYRRLGPSLRHHMEMQAATDRSLKELEVKALHIEKMAGALWWDSKMLMCAVIIFAIALCVYTSFLHTLQISQEQLPLPQLVHKQGQAVGKFEAATPRTPKDFKGAVRTEVARIDAAGEATGKVPVIDVTPGRRTTECEVFSMAEESNVEGMTPEERWWMQSPQMPQPEPAACEQRL